MTQAIAAHRSFRKDMVDLFPLPDFQGCVNYALSECGEVISATMTEGNSHHVRNVREDEHTVDRELVDLFLMLDSAVLTGDLEEFPLSKNDHFNADPIIIAKQSIMDILTGFPLALTRNYVWQALQSSIGDDEAYVIVMATLAKWHHRATKENHS